MRIVFFGTSEFAVPILKVLLSLPKHSVELIITQPDKKGTRGRKIFIPSPVKVYSNINCSNIHILQPKNINTSLYAEIIRKISPDIAIVASFGQIISREILELSRLGYFNIHPSLLPKYRGASPIAYAIFNGDNITGISIFRMTEKLDAGPIIAQKEFLIRSGITRGELEQELAELGAKVLIDILPKIESNTITEKIQNESLASYSPKITAKDCCINWHKTSQEIANLINGLNPSPLGYTFWTGRKSPLRLNIIEAKEADEKNSKEAGSIISVSKNGICVQCGRGQILITKLKPEGSREMTAQEFLNGYKITTQHRLEDIHNS